MHKAGPVREKSSSKMTPWASWPTTQSRWEKLRRQQEDGVKEYGLEKRKGKKLGWHVVVAFDASCFIYLVTAFIYHDRAGNGIVRRLDMVVGQKYGPWASMKRRYTSSAKGRNVSWLRCRPYVVADGTEVDDRVG
ncbi:hypothetical protein VTK26DRAFT_6351 [Humicola hyalothermophila]